LEALLEKCMTNFEKAETALNNIGNPGATKYLRTILTDMHQEMAQERARKMPERLEVLEAALGMANKECRRLKELVCDLENKLASRPKTAPVRRIAGRKDKCVIRFGLGVLASSFMTLERFGRELNDAEFAEFVQLHFHEMATQIGRRAAMKVVRSIQPLPGSSSEQFALCQRFNQAIMTL